MKRKFITFRFTSAGVTEYAVDGVNNIFHGDPNEAASYFISERNGIKILGMSTTTPEYGVIPTITLLIEYGLL